MDVDDIYGDDLLGGAAPPQSQPQQHDSTLETAAIPNNSNTTTIPQDYTLMSEDELRAALQEWETTFQEELREGGIFSGIVGAIQPLTILNELRRAHSSEQKARAEAAALRQRLAGAAAEAAARIQEDVFLRKELLAARTSTDPSVLQLRQLLLEPAVNREFNRLSAATAAANLEASTLKSDVRLLHDVATNPNAPRALAAKIRTLEEKCESLVQASEEGEGAKNERAVAMARSQLEEMRHRYGELEDHTHSLEDEMEVLQRELVTAERRVAALSSSGGSGGGSIGEGRKPVPMVGAGAGAGAPLYHHGQQQQGGWGRGPPMHTQGPPGGGGGGGDRGYYNRGPQGHHQQGPMGSGGAGGGGKRPRDY